MKGEIIDIGMFVDEFRNVSYRITIEFKERPLFKLGEIELKQ